MPSLLEYVGSFEIKIQIYSPPPAVEPNYFNRALDSVFAGLVKEAPHSAGQKQIIWKTDFCGSYTDHCVLWEN